MNKKLIKVSLVGKTNAGKSTLINSFVEEKISIINKKINTTQDSIVGILNIDSTQFIFYDTPGSNFLKTISLNQKKLKKNLWHAIDQVDLILYIVDSFKYDFLDAKKDLIKLSEVNKPIIFVFNKIDLINSKDLLPLITELEKTKLLDSYFNISAKNKKGLFNLIQYLDKKSIFKDWIYNDNEITDKDDIYISNECTRNSILEYLHKEIPYNLVVKNTVFKKLKNKDLKIKQIIQIVNIRYKSIILGKGGLTIKRIRENSQEEIGKIFNCKVHLYIEVQIING